MAATYNTILVTGGAGFIGSNFIRHMYQTYHDLKIVNLDLLTYAGNIDNLHDIEALEAHLPPNKKRYVFIQGDICSAEVLAGVFSLHNFDMIFHFAAESHVDRSIMNVTEFIRTNIDGTRSLAEAARKYGVGRFVHISTDEVYGSIPEGQFATEEYPLNPTNPYSASKAGAELILQAYMRTHALPALIVRGSNNYGPYQYPEKLIPLAITNILEGKRIPVHGTGIHKRSWLHVEDFCAAINLVAHEGELYKTYNVAGEERSNTEVLTSLAGQFGAQLGDITSHVNDRPGADLRYAPHSGLLQRELGWSRRHSFDEAIVQVTRWYMSNAPWWQDIRNKKGFAEHYERQANGLWV
jgi:dTDP-glucose 4,6-dehydratase